MPCALALVLLAWPAATALAQRESGVTVNQDVLNDLARTAGPTPAESTLLPPPAAFPRSKLLARPAPLVQKKPPRKPRALAAEAPAAGSPAPRAAAASSPDPATVRAAQPAAPAADLAALPATPLLPEVPPPPSLDPDEIPQPFVAPPAPEMPRAAATAPAVPERSEASKQREAAAGKGTAQPAESGVRQVAVRSPAGPALDKLRLLFSDGSAELSPDARARLAGLSDQLLAAGDRRVQLKAYSKGEGRSDSRARRLALSRALAVRSFLIDRGIASRRIDVRAIGARADGGPEDRVDVVESQR